ncbi:hypothetical protein [Gordonia oryzae]|uniref:hypothetical protein n=1 Tax=Gordonia oryzae TaxID=2487349 RepID=UPI001FE7EEEA|nr:hypothetical protein [Gordonia oryzae]
MSNQHWLRPWSYSVGPVAATIPTAPFRRRVTKGPQPVVDGPCVEESRWNMLRGSRFERRCPSREGEKRGPVVVAVEDCRIAYIHRAVVTDAPRRRKWL